MNLLRTFLYFDPLQLRGTTSLMSNKNTVRNNFKLRINKLVYWPVCKESGNTHGQWSHDNKEKKIFSQLQLKEFFAHGPQYIVFYG